MDNITINYLDTLGAPLDPEHLAYAISLTSHFAGKTEDERLNSRRRAYLSYYLDVLYREAQQDWARRNSETNRKAQREACAIHKWHGKRMGGRHPPERRPYRRAAALPAPIHEANRLL